jgi:hypothetical protein
MQKIRSMQLVAPPSIVPTPRDYSHEYEHEHEHEQDECPNSHAHRYRPGGQAGPGPGPGPGVSRLSTGPASPSYPKNSKFVYSSVGSAIGFSVTPSVVHFRVTSLSASPSTSTSTSASTSTSTVLRKQIKLTNTAGYSQRLRIMPLEPTSAFQLEAESMDMLAPGMSQMITIVYRPVDLSYCYDSIKIHAELENMLIPIHAYPSAHDVHLPKRVQLADTQISTTHTKVLPLRCKVPVDFEYSINILEASRDITVSPMQGTLSAFSSAKINLLFKPTRCRTTHCTFEVVISGAEIEPLQCHVTGTGISPHTVTGDLTRTKKESLETTHKQEIQRKRMAMTATLNRSRLRQPTKSSRKTKTRAETRATMRSASSLSGVSGGGAGFDSDDDDDVPIRVPEELNLFTQTAMNRLLNQRKDKDDLHEFKQKLEIEKQRKINQEQEIAAANAAAELEATKELQLQQALQKSATPNETGGAPTAAIATRLTMEMRMDHSHKPNTEIDFTGSDRHVKELVFRRHLAQYANHEELVERNPTKVRIGQIVMQPEELEELRQRLNGKDGEERRLQAQRIHDKRRRRQYRASKYAVGVDQQVLEKFCSYEENKPDFDSLRNSTWDVRKRVVQRFQRAASRVVRSLRVVRRLEHIRTLADQMRTAEQVLAQ